MGTHPIFESDFDCLTEVRKMSGRQGGKAKPLKKPKKGPKDLDEDDLAHKQKMQAEKKAMAEMAKKSWWKRTSRYRWNQEIGQEINLLPLAIYDNSVIPAIINNK